MKTEVRHPDDVLASLTIGMPLEGVSKGLAWMFCGSPFSEDQLEIVDYGQLPKVQWIELCGS